MFDGPSQELWLKRRSFLNKIIDDAETGVYDVSDHATALFMDMQIAYCAGAWLSVVVMSISVIDAHLRETEAMNNSIGTAQLLTDYYDGEDIDWLRQLRNKYVHLNLSKPILEMNVWFDNQSELEESATKAMKMTVAALFQNPGI